MPLSRPPLRFAAPPLAAGLDRAHQREAVAEHEPDDEPRDEAGDQPGPLAPELHLKASAVEVRHLDADLVLAGGLRLRKLSLGDLELGADPRELGQVARGHERLVAAQHGEQHDQDAAEAHRHVDEGRAADQDHADQGQGDGDAEHAVPLEHRLADAVDAGVADVGHDLSPYPEPQGGHVDQHAQKDVVQHAREDRPESGREPRHQVAGGLHQVEYLIKRPPGRHENHQHQHDDHDYHERISLQIPDDAGAECLIHG